MAEVWSARKPAAMAGADKFVAIKVLAPHLANKPEYREMFLAEARLSMLLNHSNIVQVFDAVDEPPHCYMVMELIEGMTLAQLERGLGKQREGIPTEVAVYIVAELLRALAYAHAVVLEAGATVVHRDVSPQNVMVTTSGEVKLMDFGIARFATEDTQANFVKGKLQYMPPEQLRKQTRKPTIDLFAVGGILHELLDGRRFRGRIEETRLLGMVLDGEIPPLRETTVIPAELDALRLGLLAAKEEERIQSAKEALQRIYDWSGYRVASIELEALVQRFVAPSSSMSGPATYVDTETSGLHSIDDASVSTSGSGLLASLARAEEREPTSDSELRKVDPIVAAETVVAFEPEQPAWRRWALRLAAPLAFTSLGMILMLVLGGRDDAPQAAEQPLAQAGEPTTEPVVEAPVKPVEPVALPEPVTGEAGGDAAGGGAPGSAADDDARPSKAVENVAVEFVANEFFFVYVKVGTKVLTLEPRARTKLAAGRHTVYLRTDREGKWVRAGKIDVDASHSYRVEMKRPAGLAQHEVSK
jgi:serine/threonine-protein kinase